MDQKFWTVQEINTNSKTFLSYEAAEKYAKQQAAQASKTPNNAIVNYRWGIYGNGYDHIISSEAGELKNFYVMEAQAKVAEPTPDVEVTKLS